MTQERDGDRDGASVPDWLAEWQRLYAQYWSGLTEQMQGATDSDAAKPSMATPFGAANSPQLANLMSHAMLLWMNGGARYSGRVGEIYARYWSAYFERMSHISSGMANPEQEQRIMLDAARAFLRELVDLTYQEARLLQAEIDKLDAEARCNAAGENKSGRARRLVRAVD